MKNTIRVERAKLRISQSELAEKVGMTTQGICLIENGKADPKVKNALKLAKFFKMEVAELFCQDSE